jgi:hypothetical protein
MIKKIILTTFAMLFFVQLAQSQVILSLLFGDKLNSDKIKFGLDGGVNFASVSNLQTAKTSTNFNIGFYFDFKLNENSDNWYLHSGVKVKSTLGSELSPYSLDDNALDSLFADGNVKHKVNYFNVPALLRYKFKSKLFIELGPVISLRYKAVDEFIAKVEDKKDLVYKRDIRDEISRFDIGFEGGIGFGLKYLNEMNVGVRYYQGLLNTSTFNVQPPQRNSSFSIFASIPIGAGEKAQAKKKAAAEKKAAANKKAI